MTTGFRIFIAVLTLAWLPAAALGQSGNLTLLHVNDVYEIAAKKGQGGLAQLMTLLKAERARAEHHLTTLGGDLLSPSVLSGLTQGKQMIEVFSRIARVFLDDCLTKHTNGGLDVETAAMAKWWTTDLQCKVIDQCLQLFGGYGYMWEYPIARAYADARVQRIYAGTNEIMKELIGRGL